MDASVLEKAKLDNLIHDLKEELKVNFLAKQELKKQLETAAESEKGLKSELKKKEKELKTEIEKTKVSVIAVVIFLLSLELIYRFIVVWNECFLKRRCFQNSSSKVRLSNVLRHSIVLL